MLTIGEKFKKLRVERGWRQNWVAEKAHMTPGHLSDIENNRTDPRLNELTCLAAVFSMYLYVDISEVKRIAEIQQRTTPALEPLQSPEVKLTTEVQQCATLALLEEKQRRFETVQDEYTKDIETIAHTLVTVQDQLVQVIETVIHRFETVQDEYTKDTAAIKHRLKKVQADYRSSAVCSTRPGASSKP